jgi:hypothetical protein
MNTRSFLKSLLVAAIAPQVLIPKSDDRQKWKRRNSGIWALNPAYSNAQYESVLFSAKDYCGTWAFVTHSEIREIQIETLILREWGNVVV